jgi:hypothetical protein
MSDPFSVATWNAYQILSQFDKKSATMDDVRSAMDKAYVKINTFISSSPQNT